MTGELTPRRPPPIPIQYENACKAIAVCTRINEAWQWSDKADALAAWAKIYADDKIEREARILKLHAFRRMGQLARELNQAKPNAVLTQEGLTPNRAHESVVIGDLKQKKFDELTARERPPSPNTVVSIELKPCPEWARLQRALSVCQAICGHHSPRTLIGRMKPKEIARARVLLIKLGEWAREFEAAL